MIPLAHSARNGKEPQTYQSHVSGVVHLASNNIQALFPYVKSEKAVKYLLTVNEAAENHDLGKLAEKNQDTLTGKMKAKRLPIEHRDAGVKRLLGSAKERPSATLVFSHHRPGLPNLMDESVKTASFRFPEAMPDSDSHLADYINTHIQETGSLPKNSEEIANPKFTSMEYRILLSCLVDADYTDSSGEQISAPEPLWVKRLEKLDQYIQNLQKRTDAPLSERNQLRNEFYANARSAPSEPLEYCDSPVGTGKTTAVMAHMLKTAAEKNLRHIFVVLPYTNIISQTVKILRKALVLENENPMEIVAEHHHQADFDSYELRHLATAWTAPIIVTTAVQFFETLASNLPAKLRKLHQLPGSGIIIDENHAALPLELMPPAWKWITSLTSQWGCYFCLCSGTSFKFWDNQYFKKISSASVFPLLEKKLSEKLVIFESQRISLNAHVNETPHFNGVYELLDFMKLFRGSQLIVLNTVKSAAYLSYIMRNEGLDVLHLSTALTPSDREVVIDEVKRRLDLESNYKTDWTLVATSCVECGMDFSFHYGFCELRSLQSYLQLGGRINRNGEHNDSSLICFTISEDGFGNNRAFDIPISVFIKQIKSGLLPNLTVTQAVSQSFEMESRIMGGLPDKICNYEKNNEFMRTAKDFRVIADETLTVIADADLARRFRAGASITARELQRGSVNLRHRVAKDLNIDTESGELSFLDETQYDSFLGYMKSLV